MQHTGTPARTNTVRRVHQPVTVRRAVSRACTRVEGTVGLVGLAGRCGNGTRGRGDGFGGVGQVLRHTSPMLAHTSPMPDQCPRPNTPCPGLAAASSAPRVFQFDRVREIRPQRRLPLLDDPCCRLERLDDVDVILCARLEVRHISVCFAPFLSLGRCHFTHLGIHLHGTAGTTEAHDAP